MVLIQRSWVVALGLLAACSQSLFDDNGDTGGDDSGPAPLTCPATCIANASGDFNGTATGATKHWRYLDDHRDRTWTAMAPSATTMTGADKGNNITTCAAHPAAAACKQLPGALLMSSVGPSSAADPAIEITAPTTQVVQLNLHVLVPNGNPQQILVYRNSREDALINGLAEVGSTLDQQITLDAIAGDRFLVALAPVADGATDVGVQLFLSATGAPFPSSCQIALSFSGVSTTDPNTVDNVCGNAFTHKLDRTSTDQDPLPTPPDLSTGPYPELGMAANFTPDNYYEGTGILDKSHDTTLQFWVQLRAFADDTDASWLFSDLDLDAANGGGIGVAIEQFNGTRFDATTSLDSTGASYTDAFAPFTVDQSWQFVRVVQTDGNVDVCINGKHVTQSLVAPGRLGSTFPPFLGKNVQWNPSGAFLDGKIDDVRFLTGALPCVAPVAVRTH